MKSPLRNDNTNNCFIEESWPFLSNSESIVCKHLAFQIVQGKKLATFKLRASTDLGIGQ